jgi:hypothetical protein
VNHERSCSQARWLRVSCSLRCKHVIAVTARRFDQQLLLPATLGRASLLVDARPMSLSHSVATGLNKTMLSMPRVEALSYLTRNRLACMLTRAATLYLPSSSIALSGYSNCTSLCCSASFCLMYFSYPPLMDVLAKYRHVRFTALHHGSWKARTHRCMHAVVCPAWCKQVYYHGSPSCVDVIIQHKRISA